MNALHPITAALDAAPEPLQLFIRDDDGGWDDARLFALLDCTGRAGVPIDLALIPQATSAPLAASLAARLQAAPRLVGVHQHGFAHLDHEAPKRKCEFGDARGLDAQRADLAAGRERLHECFGARLETIFTPPWNRCSAATPTLLAELGYAALSRDRGAPAQHALPELPVDIDWSKQRRRAAAAGEDFAESLACELARCISGAGSPLGLMLHHADMQAGELALLARVFAALDHPRVRWHPMRELIGLAGVSVAQRAAL